MEIIAVVIMIAGGIAAALFAMTASAISKAESSRVDRDSVTRDELAASILFQILVHGGITTDEALRKLRRDAGLAARVTSSIDLTSWAQSFANNASAGERHQLLESAVQLAMSRNGPIPLRQYCSLLDLNFALGFQTDALARLHEQYGFEYVDHAKNARPQAADRGGGATPLFVRETVDERELLVVLGLSGTPTRHDIISAYRRLAAAHHPDKVADKSAAAQDAAALRFIELTRAYERLMAIHRD